MQDFETLKLDTHKNILIVTLNRPQSRNAINSVMMLELKILWQSLYVNFEKYRCVVLTGSESAFCAGADLKERKNLDLETWRFQHAVFEQALLSLSDCPIPVIAAVNGAAFGGGLELLLLCDFAYAAETATFSQSEVRVGLMPGAMGTQNLPRACGLRRAKELTFTGATFTAEEALQWGIINKICKPESLWDDALQTAEMIADNAPLAVSQAKKSLQMSQHLDLKSGFNFELESYNRLLTTEDREEGIAAFNEKRKAIFTGK